MSGSALKDSVASRCFGQRLQVDCRAENGNVTVFTLSLFVLMLLMGGLAIDLMKYEQTRTTLQSTLDRSTLAAASLTQDLDPESVVRDYFDASGMTDTLTNVVVTEGLNYRNVMAEALVDTEPFFVHMLGMDSLDAPGASTAEQRINNVEIVLVLDVSGSMGGTKLANLKLAAKEFVETLLEGDTEDRFSVAIVPYNAEVNLGGPLRAKYNATYQHGHSDLNCLELPSTVYATMGVSRTLELPMVAYADVRSSTHTGDNTYTNYTSTSSSTMDPNQLHCRTTPGNIVRLPSNDLAALKLQIDGLVASGNTSISMGMKWGLSLIEPGAREMFGELIDDGAIPEKFRGRPYDWTDTEAMKVIVLMTDGEHVSHNFVKDAYKSGESPIYRASDGNWSVYHERSNTSDDYYVPHRSSWQSTPWNSGVRQDWQAVWAAQRMTWVAWQLYARPLGTDSSSRTSQYNSALSKFRGQFASVTTMNTQLQQSCALAKTSGAIVYGIAFEAPTNGQTQISQCASSSAHYFDADGLEIQTAFRTIASNISQLRLTQ